MANTNFSAEQQSAIDNYNKQKQVLSDRGLWNTWTQREALNQLKQSWVWANANWFFVIGGTPTTTTSQTTTQNTATVTPTSTPKTNQNQGNQGGQGNQNQWRTVQQEWQLKPLDYDYYQQTSDEAQKRITDNLWDYWQKTPSYFTNYEQFKKNFSYNTRNDVQKQTLDNWRYGYDTARQLGNKSVGDLTTLYKAWQISDADLDNLRAYYPDKYNQVINQRDTLSDLEQYQDMLYWPEDTLDTSNVFNQIWNQFLNNLLNSSYWGNIDFFEQYQNEINTEEMRGWSDRLTDLQTEIDKIDTDLNTLYKDIEKRYEGTGASTAKIQAVYADEAYDLQIQRNSLALEQQSLATKYNSRLQEAQQNFSMRVQQHQLELQEKNQYMSELWFAMDLINFETNEEADERAWKNWTRQIDYQYWNIDSMDKTSRRKAVENSVSEILKQYDWIPMIRSKDQMVDDVLALVDWGMKLWEALTQNIITPIQSKPEYVNRYNNKLWVNSAVSYQMWPDWNLTLVWWSASVPIGTSWNNYKTIDLGNWYSVSVDWNKTVTINGQNYRITQLWWDTATSWIDLAPAVRWDNQEVQAFVSWTVIRSWEDSNSDVYWHWKNKYIEILWDDWYVYRYNHLNDWDTWYATWNGKNSVLNWTRVEAWTVIWHMWETWKAQWVHLDLAIYDWSRANSMSVSPLNIKDQARIFFNSVQASWLGIGSVSNTSTTTDTRTERDYSWLTPLQITRVDALATELLWKTQAKSDITTHNAIADMMRQGMSEDQITDAMRVSWEDAVLNSNPEVYSAMKSIFSKSSSRDQNKTYNFKELIEDELSDWNYTNVLEDIFSAARADRDVMTLDDSKAISNMTETASALQDIKQLYEEYIAAGWEDWVIKGSWNNIKNKRFKVSWDAQLTQIANRLQLEMNSFVKRMSWLTVSDRERKIYEQLFPNTKQSSEAFFNNLQVFFDNANNEISTIYWLALWTDRYNSLMNWYKDISWSTYSFAGRFNNSNYQSSYRIDIPSSTTNYNNSADSNYVLNGN